MTELEKYERINKCESVADLEQAIIEIAEEDGNIDGKSTSFNAKEMADRCMLIFRGIIEPNWLTRNYGIRQQMFYIMYYENKLS